jgi:hypothetical protein
MWSVDVLADAVSAAALTVASIGQLAGDLEIFASPAFGYVTLDASLCRASVLMPQKRNPYALPVLRGGAGTLIGRLTGLLATGLTPSARTDNWLYAYGEVTGAVELAGRLVRLGSAVLAGLHPDTGVLGEQAARHFTTAADLAEELSRRSGLGYRTAYRVVGRSVAAAVERGETELTADLLSAASERSRAHRCRPCGRVGARRIPPLPCPPGTPRAPPAPGGCGSTHGTCSAGWQRRGGGTPPAGPGSRRLSRPCSRRRATCWIRPPGPHPGWCPPPAPVVPAAAHRVR